MSEISLPCKIRAGYLLTWGLVVSVRSVKCLQRRTLPRANSERECDNGEQHLLVPRERSRSRRKKNASVDGNRQESRPFCFQWKGIKQAFCVLIVLHEHVGGAPSLLLVLFFVCFTHRLITAVVNHSRRLPAWGSRTEHNNNPRNDKFKTILGNDNIVSSAYSNSSIHTTVSSSNYLPSITHPPIPICCKHWFLADDVRTINVYFSRRYRVENWQKIASFLSPVKGTYIPGNSHNNPRHTLISLQ